MRAAMRLTLRAGAVSDFRRAGGADRPGGPSATRTHPRHPWVQAFCRRQAKKRIRAVGRVSAVSLSPATDGVHEPILTIPDPNRNATGGADCHLARPVHRLGQEPGMALELERGGISLLGNALKYSRRQS
jgi:hypothetical protein